MRTAVPLALACLFSVAGISAAYTDDCSGRDHTAGTVLGAAGGAAIGGAASHNAGGAIAGAVVGGLAGNAIARAQDCQRGQGYRSGGYDRGGQAYYGPTYAVAPDEGDYWGVESYDDFNADYRHIQYSIDRARERGSLRPGEARRFSEELQRIQYHAERQQRRGRFNPQEIEDRLGQLRDEMREARRENRAEQRSGYR